MWPAPCFHCQSMGEMGRNAFPILPIICLILFEGHILCTDERLRGRLNVTFVASPLYTDGEENKAAMLAEWFERRG